MAQSRTHLAVAAADIEQILVTLASGIYLYKLQTERRQETRKLLLLR